MDFGGRYLHSEQLRHNQNHLRNAPSSRQLSDRSTTRAGLERQFEKPGSVVVLLLGTETSQGNCFHALDFLQARPVSSALTIYMQTHTTTPPREHTHTHIQIRKAKITLAQHKEVVVNKNRWSKNWANTQSSRNEACAFALNATLPYPAPDKRILGASQKLASCQALLFA